MTRALLAPLAVALLLPGLAGASERGAIVLDGERREVRWNDGDSFGFEGPGGGKRDRQRARVTDYNTLENFGPVHRWGGWDRWELFELSQQASKVAAAKAWACTSSGAPDKYGRLLVRCPELAKELVRQGHAMVFAVGGAAPEDLLALQKDAQRRKAGMWRKGVPSRVVSGAHSETEGEGYDRVVDTATGVAEARAHERTYETCDEVCVGEGAEAACYVYVPFKRRYRDPPPCLTDPKVKPRPPSPR